MQELLLFLMQKPFQIDGDAIAFVIVVVSLTYHTMVKQKLQ
jgi:hypothetical protein